MTKTLVVIPDLGEIVEQVRIVRWLKEAGESVEADEDLVEITTEKLDVMIQAPAAGRVAEIHAPAGEKVKIGAAIGTIDGAVDDQDAKAR